LGYSRGGNESFDASVNTTALKTRWKSRWRSGLIGMALSLLAGWVLLQPFQDLWRQVFRANNPTAGPSTWLSGLSYDLPIWLHQRRAATEAVVVEMDDDSYRKLDQKPEREWDRALHTKLIRHAKALGAAAVVFDIWFADDATNATANLASGVEQEFSQAIAEMGTGKVVVGALLQPTVKSEVLVSTPLLSTTNIVGARQGLVELPSGPDRIVRQHYTNASFPEFPLAWQAAAAIGRAPADPLPRRARWLNFYQHTEPMARESYYRVVHWTNFLPADAFAGKVLFVGRPPVQTPSGTSQGDQFPIPPMRWSGKQAPGVVIHATAFLNLIRGDWLEEMDSSWQSFLCLAVAIVFGLGLTLQRPWVAFWAGLFGIGCVFGFALWLVWHERIWFPWAVICLVQIPCALTWSVIAHTRWLATEKADLEEKLATSLSALASARARPAGGAGAEALVPPSVPDHTLLRCVGSGGYGDVWLARDLVGNFRAVKAVYRNRFPRAEPFDREFRGIQKYSPISRTHPGWIDILHIGRNDPEGYFFYIMEAGDDETAGQQFDPERYVPRTLAGELRRRGKLPLAECLQHGLALVEALAHLHQHSLIHRDVKPSNVIFVQGAPKFADIGLVTEVGRPGHDVSFLGTEGYVAPEGPGSASADLYSLGKLLYELSTGRDRRAFPELPTALSAGGADPALEEFFAVLLKLCEFEPRNRYQSAAALRTDLERIGVNGKFTRPA